MADVTDADGDCQCFQTNSWGIEAYGRSYTECGARNPVRSDGSQVFCVVLNVEIVGAVVGATTEPLVAIGDDIDGVEAERENTSSEFGESTTFRVVQTEPGANIRSATVFVDGVEIDCTG